LRRSTEILELTLRGHQIEELAAWLGRVVLAHPGNLPDRIAPRLRGVHPSLTIEHLLGELDVLLERTV